MPGAKAGPPPVQRSDTPQNQVIVSQHMGEIVQAFNKPERYQQFLDLLGSEAAVNRWKQVALHTINSDPNLLRNATPMSVIEACRDAAVLGLQVNGLSGEGWLILYGDQAKFQAGWQGLLKLVYQSPKVAVADVQVVYEKDFYEIDAGTNPQIRHRRFLDTSPVKVVEGRGQGKEVERPIIDAGPVVAVYAWARLTSGELLVEPMTWSQVEQVRKVSPSVRANRASPWDDWWEEMAKKTVLRRLMKRLPRSTAMDVAMAMENALDNAERDNQPSGHATARTAALDALAARYTDENQQPAEEQGAQTDAVEGGDAKGTTTLDGQAGGEVVTGDEPQQTKNVTPAEDHDEPECGDPSPHGGDSPPCAKPKDHDGLHRNRQKETWQ